MGGCKPYFSLFGLENSNSQVRVTGFYRKTNHEKCETMSTALNVYLYGKGQLTTLVSSS